MNKISIIGNVGRAPEKKSETLQTFTVAVTERGYTKQDGTQVPDHTDWFNVAVFGSLAKVCQFIRKGEKIFVHGRMRCYTSVDPQTQQKREIWGIVAEDIELIAPKPKENSQEQFAAQVANQQAGVQQAPPQQAYQQQQMYQPQGQAPQVQQPQQPLSTANTLDPAMPF